MTPQNDHIVFFRELNAEQVDALRAQLAGDEATDRLFRAWYSARMVLAGNLRRGTVSRHDFALFVLAERGRPGLLTPDEAERAERLRPAIVETLTRHAGLSRIADDITADADAFEAAWDEWFVADMVSAPAERLERPAERLERPAVRRRRNRVMNAPRWLARAGVGAAVVAFAALLFVVGRRDLVSETVITTANEVRVVDLGDGTSIRVLGNSRLTYVPRVDASAIDRQVELEGSAFFDVARADRGFLVQTANAQAIVLGTSFGVRTGDEETEVVLEQGRLTLAARASPQRAVVLEPGQMSRVTRDGPSAPVDVRLHEELSWTGLFIFRTTSLADIMTELSDYYGVEISAEQNLLDEQVTGRFEQKQTPAEILQVVAATLGARIDTSTVGSFRLLSP